MTKEKRAELRGIIVAAVEKITEEQSNRESVVTIGGHEIARRLIYAGGSQWSGCGRDWDWDCTESGWAWIVDGQYRLTVPDLFGFDGHNIIERQTGYYLQDGYDPQTTPEHDGRDEIDLVPNRILIAIGKGLAAAKAAAEQSKQAEDSEASSLIAQLS